jgi:hypothetical protein
MRPCRISSDGAIPLPAPHRQQVPSRRQRAHHTLLGRPRQGQEWTQDSSVNKAEEETTRALIGYTQVKAATTWDNGREGIR